MSHAEQPGAQGAGAAVIGGKGRCENCGAPGQDRSTWCRQCGYYPVLGRCVELDQEWEAAADPNAPQNQPEDRPAVVVALRAIPRWVWPVLGAALAAVALTLAGRMLTPPESMLRVRWAFLHLAVGGLAFLAAQVWACVKAAADDPQFGLLDAVLRPLAVWKPALAEMPRA